MTFQCLLWRYSLSVLTNSIGHCQEGAIVTPRGPLQSKKPSREKRKEATDNVRSFLWVIQKKNTLSKIIIITTHHASPWGLVRRDQKGIWSLGGPTVTFLKILKNWVWRGQDLVTELQDGQGHSRIRIECVQLNSDFQILYPVTASRPSVTIWL